ncbi:50S ribosomal protein L21 [Paracoccaceae bacterium]|nr:50S ribosomal protein L21 [Paracoccaceae bacterium]
MYAIIETGGKQYKVQKNDVLAVEKLSAKGGDKVQFNSVLLTGGKDVTVGNPLIKGAGVQATVIDQIKDKKVISFVKRRRKSSSKSKKGHRQQITLVKITDILEHGADKTNVQEAKSGKGIKIDYSAKVNINKNSKKVAETTKVKSAKKAPVKKEAEAQIETKEVKTSSVAKAKKKGAKQETTADKKDVKKKSS